MEISLNLQIGELTRRPNRFIFEGIADGNAQRWHCPTTGKIGLIENFHGMPCLFSPAIDCSKRTTQGTVEAISINHGRDWIGINQNHINGWMESFLKKNALPAMIDTDGCLVKHEIKVDDSRIDLVVERMDRRTFLELKTPTRDFLLAPGDTFSRPPSDTYFDRGLRHFKTLAKLAKEGNRTIVALCFMYDATELVPPVRNRWNTKIIDTIREANDCGVENWQINLKITPNALKIVRYGRSNYTADQK
jgi:sugar fermentation stimulation protein A